MKQLFAICFVVVLITGALPDALSKNILFYAAVGTHSTRISMMPLMSALANKGHNVTHLSAYEDNDPKKNPKIHEVIPKKWKEAMGPWEKHTIFFNVRKNKRMTKSWYDLRNLGMAACHALYSDQGFIDWVKSSQFDVVIVEAIVNECGYGLVHVFNAKLMIYSTTTAWPSYIDAHGLPDESSSISDLIFGFPPGNQMSFLERFVNALNPVVYTVMRHYYYFPILEELTKNALGMEEIPWFRDIEKNASLILLTTHYSLDYPRSLPPNAVMVGGVVVGGEKNLLPKDMETFIDKAKHGFIFISFGTIAEFTNFDLDIQLEFINALKQFPGIRFIWKSTKEINATLPDHILVTPWAPQQTLLVHPKIKAFITHSGMGSTTEGIHFSVPMICFPILAEQDLNANSLVSREAGIKLEIVSLKQNELEHAISEILHNKKYRQAMTKLTEIFNDRPVPPLENAIWWVEFILRHENSNEFLRSPSVQQSWWVRRQIDVWITALACVLLLTFIPVYLIYLIARKLLATLTGKKLSNKLKKH